MNKIKNVPLVVRIPQNLYSLIECLARMNNLTPGRFAANILIDFFNNKLTQVKERYEGEEK